MCTREPKRRRSRRPIDFQRPPPFGRFMGRNPSSMRRSMRISQRTTDSGVDTYYDDPNMVHAHSDTELR